MSYPDDAFRAADHRHDGKRHLLLAASGSVATIKLPNIVQALSQLLPQPDSAQPGLSIRIVLTRSAARFLAGQSAEQPSVESLRGLACVDAVYQDEDEWRPAWVRQASILHIELRRWADLMVVAPLSANSLAKMVNGLSDNLLLSVLRAWDTSGDLDTHPEPAASPPQPQPRSAKVVVVAPAMNTAMWRHPVTERQLKVLQDEWGLTGTGPGPGWIEVLRPVEKELACGDVGDGAMHDWRDVVAVIQRRLGLTRPTASASIETAQEAS